MGVAQKKTKSWDLSFVVLDVPIASDNNVLWNGQESKSVMTHCMQAPWISPKTHYLFIGIPSMAIALPSLCPQEIWKDEKISLLSYCYLIIEWELTSLKNESSEVGSKVWDRRVRPIEVAWYAGIHQRGAQTCIARAICAFVASKF